MQIEERIVDNTAIVKVHGDIVLSASGPSVVDRIRALLDANRRRIVLDLSDTRYVDSSGLGELVEALTAATNRGGTVKLLGVTRRLNDLLIITKLLSVFDCFDTELEALASFVERPAVPGPRVIEIRTAAR